MNKWIIYGAVAYLAWCWWKKRNVRTTKAEAMIRPAVPGAGHVALDV